MSVPLPTLFLPHGAPNLALSRHPARAFLAGLAATLPADIRGIVMVSAHWQTRRPTLTTHPEPPTLHDFSGWGAELETMVYRARTDTALIDAVDEALGAVALAVERDPHRGFDHGAWVPLLLAWPEARLPIVQLSLVHGQDASGHLALGRALAPLARAGCLIVGSGASVHDLSALAPEGSTAPAWASEFDAWLDTALDDGDVTRLVRPHDSPAWRRAHPTTEHLMPLYVAYGAAGREPVATRLHGGYSYGSVGMSAWRFDATVGDTISLDPSPSAARFVDQENG